jgi:hypothetical protein
MQQQVLATLDLQYRWLIGEDECTSSAFSDIDNVHACINQERYLQQKR